MPSYIYKAGVVGAGAMGAGIAQVITFSGLPVVLKDVNDAQVKKGMDFIRSLYDDRVKKGKMTAEQLEQKMMLVQGTTSWDDFQDVDLVIEAVFEDLDLKKQVFAEMGKKTPDHCILASNTSALSITEMGKASGRPDKTVGIHFFNPVQKMKLVEIIPTPATSQEVTEAAVTFVEGLRKIPVTVKECAGFLVNRILMPYLGEAGYALQERAATATEIDDALMAFGMPMGPFLLADSLGLDVCHKVAGILQAAYGERAKAPKIIELLYEQKRYGMKSGAGFYVYGDAPDTLEKTIDQVGAKKSAFSVERIIYPMVNEAAMCLQEGVSGAADIDMAMLAGTGFPQDKGGILRYADSVGLDVVLQGLQKFEKELGPRFKPCRLLEQKVASGALGVKSKKGFHDYT